jgi:hypothetical protein
MCKSTESFNDAINVAIHQAHIVLKSIDNNASSVEEEWHAQRESCEAKLANIAENGRKTVLRSERLQNNVEEDFYVFTHPAVICINHMIAVRRQKGQTSLTPDTTNHKPDLSTRPYSQDPRSPLPLQLRYPAQQCLH